MVADPPRARSASGVHVLPVLGDRRCHECGDATPDGRSTRGPGLPNLQPNLLVAEGLPRVTSRAVNRRPLGAALQNDRQHYSDPSRPPPCLAPLIPPSPTPSVTTSIIRRLPSSSLLEFLPLSVNLLLPVLAPPLLLLQLLVPVSRPLYPVVGGEGSGNWDPLQNLDHDSPGGWGKDSRFRGLVQLRVPTRVPNRVPTNVPKRGGTLFGIQDQSAY